MFISDTKPTTSTSQMWDPFEEDYPGNGKNTESVKESGGKQENVSECHSTSKTTDCEDNKTEQESMDLEEMLEQCSEQDSKQTESNTLNTGSTDKPSCETGESAKDGLSTENATEKE